MRDSRSLRSRTATLGVAVLTALVLAGAALPAGARAGGFCVNGGAGYTRTLRVSAGDAGWSPFFGPGVVVWDGGSVIAGRGAAPGNGFPAQTLAVIPREVTSYVSATAAARIAEMLAEAPEEVDARYAPEADLNLCVVLAGGGDFRDGGTAAEVFSQVEQYCRGRRAVGFRVIVLTVLPASRPGAFEANRLAYDAMLRANWDEFADGLADIAADPRIGDAGDEYDPQFYRPDAVHPNDAGNSVMAMVAAPVIAAQPWRSARCELRVRDAALDWQAWRPYTAATTLELAEHEGVHVVEAEYRFDGGQTIAASDEIFVDTVPPEPKALGRASVRRGRRVVLRYRVDDARPSAPTCAAAVRVTTADGRTLKAFVRRRVSVGETGSVAFTCTLPRGTYRYVVTARDAAGNRQLTPGTARLVVR